MAGANENQRAPVATQLSQPPARKMRPQRSEITDAEIIDEMLIPGAVIDQLGTDHPVMRRAIERRRRDDAAAAVAIAEYAEANMAIPSEWQAMFGAISSVDEWPSSMDSPPLPICAKKGNVERAYRYFGELLEAIEAAE